MIPQRILVVGQTPPPYGGQTVMIQLLLDGAYQEIELVHVRMSFSKELNSNGRLKLAKIWELFRVVGAIYRAKISMRPKVLYYPPSGPKAVPVIRDIFILCATRWLFSKTVFHLHAGGISEFYPRLNPALRWFFRIALFNPDLVIRTASLAAEDGKGLHSKREVVVPNGVPDSAGRSIVRTVVPGEPVRILLVALLREDKGVLVAISAVQQLLTAGMDVELTCMGEWDSLEVQARAESLIESAYKSKFKFPGALTGDEKWEYFRKSDIFLFPSYFHSETFGIVLLEAMSFSLPMVATRWRGIPEVVEEGSCALLCQPQDVAGCRDALAQLVRDPSLRIRMGEKARERFQRYFTIEAHRNAMERALSQLKG
ncbi:MAG: glycosyltransferase family 4 protein [Terracidiphilus sp.]